MAVYPVDARRLIGAFPSINFNRVDAINPKRGPPPPMIANLNTLGSNIDTMKLLADKTGGKAYYNRNDIDGAVRSAFADSAVSYVLGYYPTHGKWDGRFVDLNVKVNRRGVSVRFRKGYYAGAEPQLEVKEIQSLLKAAAFSPLESTSVGLTVRTDDVTRAFGRALKVSTEVDPHDINLILQDGRWVGSLDFLISQRNVEGRVVASDAGSMGMRLTPETYEQLKAQGVTFSKTVEIDPSAALLRMVVRDARSGSIGTVTVLLKPNGTRRGG